MIASDRERAVAAWRQGLLPAIYARPKADGGKLLARLPAGTRGALALLPGRRPEWDAEHHCWLVPRARFREIVARLLSRWGAAYVITVLNEREVCAPACWDAKSDPIECQCSCLGMNHGGGHPGGHWVEVSEAFAVTSRGRQLAVKLVKPGRIGRHPDLASAQAEGSA